MLLLNYSECSNEVGLDESGRGCLAGPVTAAAVILPEDFKNDILNDSKLLTKTKRNLLRPIIEREALDFNVQHVFPEDIDAINILNASIKAMHLCLANLKQKPEFIIVDGNQFKPYNNIKHATIIKGDSKYSSIAAASVLAKTYRDAYMLTLHKAFPQYGWDKNKGYPTKSHREAIIKFGVSPHHRKSFKLLPNQLKLDI